ncbi:MAG: hypothetical protein QM757_26300 [Paludibaculum sp.]
MQLPLAFLDITAVEEVSIDLWRDVFEATDWPTTLSAKRTSFGHEDVLRALEQDNPSDDLLQALETLDTLGTEAGREALISAMNDRRVPLSALPTDTGEREFALRFYLGQRSNASLADVFVRAQTQVQETGDHRRYNEFIGKKAESVSKLTAKSERLRNEILRYCQEADLGDHVQVRAFEDDGAYVFNVIRTHRTKKPLAVTRGSAGRARIEYRPVHGDVLRYEAPVGRLRIAARAATMVEFYRRTLGAVLFGDESFFDGAPVCSLRVLQDHGRGALERHGVFGIARVWMTECLWERGDRNLYQIRSADCFRSIDELNLPLAEGELIQAKLKLEVIGRSTRPVTVNIRIPSRIEVSRKAHEALVEKFLDAVGIRNAALKSPGSDFWSLHPWRHPVSVWRSVFGTHTDALIESGVLATVQLDSVPHPEHSSAGRALRAHAVPPGSFYGISEAAEMPSRSLSATDLDGLELVPEKFRLHLRSRLEISNGASQWDRGELLDLGQIDIGGERLHVMYALRQPSTGVGDRVRARAGGAHPVLLIPSSQTNASELAKVILGSVYPSRTEVVRGAIHACGLADRVPAIHIAPDDARLVVDTHCKKVWVDGVEITGLAPGSHPFRFVELMARATAPLDSQELSAQLSSSRGDEDVTTRQAKSKARQLIRESMSAAGRSLNEDPFPPAGIGSYRCALPAFVK